MSMLVRRFFFSSLSLWMALGLFGIYFVINLQRYVNFGIDLVGGTYVTLEVQTEQLFENELHDHVARLMQKLITDGISTPKSQKLDMGKLIISFANEHDAERVVRFISTQPQLGLTAHYNRTEVTFDFTESARKQILEHAIASNEKVLRARIDMFGVGEVPIARHGDKQIVIELPHVQDSQQARARIGTSALLEIKPVLDHAQTKELLLEKLGGKLPDNRLIVADKRIDGGFYLVPRFADITGKQLKHAFANQQGGKFHIEPAVSFELNSEGAEKFYNMTNMPNALIAILVDNVVVTAARAREPIHGGQVEITGDFTIEKAQDLAKMLSSGAFAAPVKIVEDRTISPSLGAESIRKGLISCAVGLLLLFIFSIIIYRLAGLFAFIVLLFNLLLILYAMSLLGATLTLPGIAGMVLTLGMAIDASVLIYERIREELSRAVPLYTAVQTGFSGALAVILDANITTFLAALVLYWIGTGPIQGFAVTMMVGIISTLLTGLFLLKAIFNYALAIGLRKLRI